MPDKNLIYRKIAEILKQLNYIKKLIKLSEKQLLLEETQLFLAERVMERLIGAAIDINMHLVSDIRGEVSQDYFNSFIDLAQLKVFPIGFAKKIAPSAGLRNILVHEYQELDLKKFRASMKMALENFPKYVRYIEKVMENAEFGISEKEILKRSKEKKIS